ncbi:hypothetical protein JW979_02845 [bacterium]|nr:hypothetical protein [candidate division CSSED10-310 bacterium]
MNRIGKHILFWAVVLILVGMLHGSQVYLDGQLNIKFVDKSPVFLPNGEVLKWLSMGYRSLVADYLWIKCILYIGRRSMDEENPYYIYELFSDNPETFEAAHKNPHDLLHGEEEHNQMMIQFLDRVQKERQSDLPKPPDSLLFLSKSSIDVFYGFRHSGLMNYGCPLIDRVTTLDPNFIDPYLFGGMFLTIETGEIDWGIDLLKKGFRSNPNRWEFPYYLGWLYWVYKFDFNQTHEYLMEAVQLEGCPKFVGRIMAGFAKNLNKSEMTKMYLTGIMESTDNEKIHSQIFHILEKLDKVDNQK